MMDVYLHGPLGERFGEKHSFDVRNPMQAVSALDANYPGFKAAFAATNRWQIVVDGAYGEGGEVRHGYISAIGPASKEIHFYPLVEGRAGLFGAILLALFPGLGVTVFGGVTAAALLGGLLFGAVAIGLSFLLRPKKPEAPEEAEKRDNNYAFSGPINTVTQGIGLPLIYGRCMVGSVVISAGISTDNYVIPPDPNKEGVEDNLGSKQIARIIDLLSEGPIAGIVGGYRGIYLDGTPAMDANGTSNFPTFQAEVRLGNKNQSRMSGFPFIESEYDGTGLLKYLEYESRIVDDPEIDQVRFTFQFPSMQRVEDDGTVYGATVSFRIDAYYNGGFYWQYDTQISGKTGSPYFYSRIITLPENMRSGPWEFQVTRITPPPKDNVTDDVYWQSYTLLSDERVFYQHSAVVGIHFDAQDFSSIPNRVYDVEGLLILIPTNYDPRKGTYSGVWNGAFKRDWSNNPAWVLYDIIVNNRYGLGTFLGATQIDKFSFYKAGQWCDQLVPGQAGLERRYLCNAYITNQSEAFDLLHQLAAVFRGFMYWNGTQLLTVADQPEDPTAQFTNANVIDGTFTYTGPDIRQINNQITVGWHDPENLGEGRIAIAEDQDSISRLGIQIEDVPGLGITRESQAARIGKWELFTQAWEGDSIQFKAGLDAGYHLRPGSIFRVMDANVAGKRRGGRIKSSTGNKRVYFDSPVNLSGGVQPWYLSCTVSFATPTYPGSNGGNLVQTLPVAIIDSAGMWAETADPFGAKPVDDSIFVLTTSTLEATLWRCMTIKQLETDQYQVEGVRHYPQKWDYVEKNKAFSEPDISDISLVPPAVTNLKVVESIVQLSSISLGVVGTLSWTSAAPRFEVMYRKPPGNWARVNTQAHQLVDLALTAGAWVFQVTPFGPTGKRGKTAVLNYTVIGLTAPPSPPKNFRVNVVDRVCMFHWDLAPEIDVKIGGHYELRWSSKTVGATWETSNTVITAIPGTATSAEAGYRVGTWLLRVFDIEKRPSADWVSIITSAPDTGFTQFARICENPAWSGNHDNTTIRYPQAWLIIASQGGGYWDDQAALIDDWLAPAVDKLPIGPSGEVENRGWYEFAQGFDAGDVFQIRLSPDLLAFPYEDPSDFFDSRMTNINTWPNFDDMGGALGGRAKLYMRTTDQDPALASAIWSPWRPFIAGITTARGFEFALELTAPLGENIGVETACVTGDFRAKFDSGEDHPYKGADTVVKFNIKFYAPPSVVITVQNAEPSDKITIVKKDKTEFIVRIMAGAAQANPRTFDWHAQGY